MKNIFYQIIFALAFAASCFGATTTLPSTVTASLNSVLTSASITGPVTISAPGYLPTVIAGSPPAFVSGTVYYVDTNGSDDRDGKTFATAWKTPRAVSGATVILTAGESFAGPVSFNGKTNAVVATDAASPAILLAPAGGGYATTWWSNSNNCTLQNVIVDSVDGKGHGGTVRGSANIVGVQLKDLSEGFDYDGTTQVTIAGGKQIGNVAGRSHYFINAGVVTWTNSGPFGPADNQSPIRFSYPGCKTGSVITNVSATQVGSAYPIAGWAIHDATGTTFNKISSVGCDIALGTAGGGGSVVDSVKGCSFNDCTVTNGKLAIIDNIVTACQFNRPACVNLTGECITVQCLPTAGNAIVNASLTSTKHGVMFNNFNNTTVGGSTLYTTNAVAPIIDGQHTTANDVGANKVVLQVK